MKYAALLVSLLTMFANTSICSATDINDPFANLKRFENKNPYEVLQDKSLRRLIKQITKKHFIDLENYLNVSSGVKVDSDGALDGDGCMPHVCSINEAKIYITRAGEIYIAILKNADKLMYFTNDKNNLYTIVSPIKEYVENFPNVTILYMSK